ncbi:DUF4177 domain-containing protein [Halocynthiibacter sp. C4]|uniref:DUF4177 domain-containing protein n=1 Tax=Halocynthiibacter sp. C4 TaxID=2992758 RepID=UPI00237BC87F|nr:DUF4177 domain-containing protein [Halocynthiibacter sp. C4]MDE0589222.1 DUF4177 domain-containing protein [Halocynthiibacter sp. C4]
MTAFEYKIVPAPQKGLKGKGMRTTEARFANALTDEVNKMAREGWEYLRSETLPCVERSTLGTKSNSFQSVLVFRREATAENENKLAAPERGKSLFAPFGKSVGPATAPEPAAIAKLSNDEDSSKEDSAETDTDEAEVESDDAATDDKKANKDGEKSA